MKKTLSFITILFVSLALGLSIKAQPAKASYLNGNSYASMATRYVRITKKMPVYKVRTGHYEAQNHFYRYGSVKKGQKVHISRWIMSTGGVWVVKSHKYYHNRRTFFVIPGLRANWYKKIK